MIVVLFFLLMSGDTFLRRLVEILPSFKNKRQAVEISQQIESDISAYLMTITLMNAGVGVISGLVAWLCGLGDPVLWGTLAFCSISCRCWGPPQVSRFSSSRASSPLMRYGGQRCPPRSTLRLILSRARVSPLGCSPAGSH